MLISDYFKDVLDNYPSQKRKDFFKSTFALDFSEKLPVEIFSYMNNEDFTAKASCGNGNWAEYPWIDIISKSFDDTQEALIMEYRFDCRNSRVMLSLIPRFKQYSDLVSVREKLLNILGHEYLGGFEIDEDSYSILSKSYSYDELNDFLINSDLDYLITIYNKLIPYFNAFLSSRENEVEFSEYERNPQVVEELIFFDKSPSFRELDDLSKESEKFIHKAEDCVFHSQSLSLEPSVKVKDIKIDYPRQDKYNSNLNNPKVLFSDDTIEEIVSSYFNPIDYKKIIDSIKTDYRYNLLSMIKEYNLDIGAMDAKDRVLLLSKSFAETEYKSVGRLLGSYSFDKIKIDDRLPDALIITSIIHELSHCLLERILKEVLMKMLETNDTPLISSFVKILLEDNDLNYLLDEFCAHTVEGRFALYGYQDYSSFNYKLDEISGKYSKDDIDYALIVANTFAYDIKDILEEYIDDDLRDEIKRQYSYISSPPKYEPLDMEIESRFTDNDFIEAISIVLISGFAESISNPQKVKKYMEIYASVI